MLSLSPSLTEACLVSAFINGCKMEPGPIIRRPHPSSLSIAYEQDKLKESNGGLGVKLNIDGAVEIGLAA